MPDSEYWRKHDDSERRRLASDLTQLASNDVSPALRSHFLWMANVWTRLAEFGPGENAGARR
jgi:hypothetical protein